MLRGGLNNSGEIEITIEDIDLVTAKIERQPLLSAPDLAVVDEMANSQVITEYKQRIHFDKAQRAGQIMYRFVTGTGSVVAVVAELNNADLLPEINPVCKHVASVFLVNGAILATDIFHTVLSKERPLAFLRLAGNGNTWKGFAKESAKFVVSMLPATGAAIGYAVIVANKTQAANDTDDNDSLSILDLLNSPFIHYNLIGIASRFLYGTTYTIINCIFPSPKEIYRPHENTHWVQDVLRNTVLRAYDDTVVAEMIRQGFFSIGGAMFTHKAYFPVLPLLLDQMVLRPLHYLFFTAHPFDNISTPWKSAPHALTEDNVGHAHVASPCDRVKTVALYSVCATTVVAVVGLASTAIVNQVFEDADPETLDSGSRIGYEAGVLAVGMLFSEAIVRLSCMAIKKVSEWRQAARVGLFLNNDDKTLNDDTDAPKPKKRCWG